ncbi:MAG: hemerythrin domain-containing protein [Bacteroidales bacterium]|nr:hemerythrin domain-containing protein [Bacteroidales bacterium]
MNIFEEIREDHKTQRSLLNTLLRTEGDSNDRRSVWEKLKVELMAHEMAEEKNFYNPMIEHDKSQEHARHSIAEHHEIDEMIKKLDDTEMSSSAWLTHFKSLRELVFHHLEEEEHEIFKVAGQVLNETEKERLAKDYRASMKRQAEKLN